MVVFHVFKKIKIKSYTGVYSASFLKEGLKELNNNPINNAIYIIDKNVFEIYSEEMSNIVKDQKYILIEATEENKSLDKIPFYVDQLVKLHIKRDQKLVAIGGGITQDITCFLATTMMRGLDWIYYPSTLLAQADSCIGSKSSINSGQIKNILGSFKPPIEIIIDTSFLQTLDKTEIFSGIGEMLKVHAINSPESFNSISQAYDEMISDISKLEPFIYDSLIMKKKLIEIDEFDLGPRNVMNYGHSFGHAIESATNYAIPHGIAVTIGMDIANFVSAELNVSNKKVYNRMHSVLDKNCSDFRHIFIDVKDLIKALSNDKKNSSKKLKLILPNKSGIIGIDFYDNNFQLEKALNKYFENYSISK